MTLFELELATCVDTPGLKQAREQIGKQGVEVEHCIESKHGGVKQMLQEERAKRLEGQSEQVGKSKQGGVKQMCRKCSLRLLFLARRMLAFAVPDVKAAPRVDQAVICGKHSTST